MKRIPALTRLLVLLVPLVALIPLARMIGDWMEMKELVGPIMFRPSSKGFDGVRWEDANGQIIAVYVTPFGPARRAGMQNGDAFYELEYVQYFTAEDLQRAIVGLRPGKPVTYSIQRNGELRDLNVRITRYPTFLYPLSRALWQFSIWGFLAGAYIHLIGLIVVGPLVRRSKKGIHALLLIALSSLWVFSNALRLILVELFGPPVEPGSSYDFAFLTLTNVGLFGWIVFPSLLLRKIVSDANLFKRGRFAVTLLLFTPAGLLGGITLLSTLKGALGPFTLDGLVVPILFHASTFIALAALVVLTLHVTQPDRVVSVAGSWNRLGSLVTLVLSLLAALFILSLMPAGGSIPDPVTGWVIVAVQLLAVAPVILVSLATLRHGKLDEVLQRGLTYGAALGMVFFSFLGGVYLLTPYLERPNVPRNAVLGLFVVILFFIFERVIRRVRSLSFSLFSPERHRTRQELADFQQDLRRIVGVELLAGAAAQVVGRAFDARSAAVFFETDAGSGDAVFGAYHPEPPFLTQRIISSVWPMLRDEGRIWARNSELNDSTLGEEGVRLLKQRGAFLAVPIVGDDKPTGLLVLGAKNDRRSVYSLEDIDLLRAVSAQLGLALERLRLLEREKLLVRETAEAQLLALRAQINPHFLFNALNTIVSLIAEQPAEAEKVVEHLAGLFRRVLQIGARQTVTLEDELALVESYLAIERARFGNQLQTHIEVQPEVGGLPVPAFIVQTLVENAVKHGIEKRRGGGDVRVQAHMIEEGRLTIEVEDTGIGIPALFGASSGMPVDRGFFGIGLRNVASRLEQMFGENDLLQMWSNPDSGTRVRLRIPVVDSSASASSLQPNSRHSG